MSETITFSLQSTDNTRLANLCGTMDDNLHHIARVLSVKINRRGDVFNLQGKHAPLAAEAIKTLYSRAGRDIDADDIRLQLAHQLQDEQDGQNGAETNVHDFPASIRLSNDRRFVPRTASQQEYWDKIRKNSVVLCAGPAGTGKTYVALAAAVDWCLSRRRKDSAYRVILSRPVIEAGGERLGFLPGDMEQKIIPYLRPLYDILHDLFGRQETGRLVNQGVIEVLPLAFMRGLTLARAALILDEAQNTVPSQIKMLLTRLGEGGKIVISGDVTQSDLPPTADNGLDDAMRRLVRIRGIAQHRFNHADIIRHPLVRHILSAYE